jgi:hypothetical protein
MKNLIFLAMLTSQVLLAQQTTKTVTYKHGQNGIELIAKNSDGMVVVSTYNAKVSIKDDIAEKVLALYQNNNIDPYKTVTIVGKEASVTGTYAVEKKDNLTSVKFIYEKVEWNSGLVEVSE